jgi:hypothetical protein
VRLDARSLAGRLADLDSASFATREASNRDLAPVAEAAEAELQRALDVSPSPEVRRRLQRLLDAPRSAVPAADVVRQLRAVAVLERIGSDEARRLLRTLADGAPAARLTREAQASLKRLALRPSTAQP